MKININQIKPNPNNPRIIKDANFKKLVQSLKDFPVMTNKLRKIVVDEGNMILGGNMRYKAALEADVKELNVEVFTKADAEENNKLTEQNKTYGEYCAEFIIKDNVSGGEWDWDELANTWDLEELNSWGLDIPDFALGKDTEEDDAPEVDEGGGICICLRHCIPTRKAQDHVR